MRFIADEEPYFPIFDSYLLHVHCIQQLLGTVYISLSDYSMTLPKTTRPTTLLPKLHTSTTVDKSKIKTKEGVDTIIQSSIASAGSKYYKDHKQLIGEKSIK